MTDFVAWLRSLGLDRYAQVFADNDVDLAALRLLSDRELQELGVSLGHRKKLMKAVADLADNPTGTEGNNSPESRVQSQKDRPGSSVKRARANFYRSDPRL